MMNFELIKSLFVNASILLAGISIIFMMEKPLNEHNREKYVWKIKIGLWAGLLGILLIVFGIPFSDTVIVDLRHIPIILSGIYGGPVSVMISVILISGSRILISNTIVAWMVFMLCAIIGTLSALLPKLGKWKPKQSMFIVNILASCILILNLYFFLLPKGSAKLLPAIISFSASIIVGMYAVYLMEIVQKYKNAFFQLEHEANFDFLTGLQNVRQFDREINKIHQDIDISSIAVMMLDIDYFKKVNDRFGHDAGDIVLKSLASCLKRNLTMPNVAFYREGGEEFSAIFKNYELDQLAKILEKLRGDVEKTQVKLPDGQVTSICISIGLAYQKHICTDGYALFKLADEALYRAKDQGRNQVCICEMLEAEGETCIFFT